MKNFKSILTLISLLCVISLCLSGCGSTQIQEISDCKANNQEQQGIAPDYDNKSSEAPSQGITVEGFYYTVTLPADWQGRYTKYDTEEGDCRYDVFCHSASMTEEGGGHLFSICLISGAEDYTVFPSYDYLGILKTPDGEFNMVVTYPTDVQFSEDTAAEYNDMADDINRIIKTVKAMGGAEFVKG